MKLWTYKKTTQNLRKNEDFTILKLGKKMK